MLRNAPVRCVLQKILRGMVANFTPRHLPQFCSCGFDTLTCQWLEDIATTPLSTNKDFASLAHAHFKS